MILPLVCWLVQTPLVVGQPAPLFDVKDQLGISRKLQDYRGKTVILAFFPGDFTPGCTAEVRAFRTAMPRIENRDAVVFGISGNDLATRQRFAQQEKLNFPLLVDPSNDLARQYGVDVHEGRPQRKTILIGPDGRIVGIDGDVDHQFYRTGDELATHHADNLALFLSDWSGELNQTIPPFWLEGNGKTISSYRAAADASVYWFVDPTCPESKRYRPVMEKLQKDPLLKKVAWLGISSRPGIKPESLGEFAKDGNLDFAFGIDRDAVYAHRFRATETGHVWVTDREGRVIYRGAIDTTKAQSSPNGLILREALFSVLSGRKVAIPEFRGYGAGLPIP